MASTAVQIVFAARVHSGANGQGMAVKNTVLNHSWPVRLAKVSVQEHFSGSISDGPQLAGQQKPIVRQLGKEVRVSLSTEVEFLRDVARDTRAK